MKPNTFISGFLAGAAFLTAAAVASAQSPNANGGAGPTGQAGTQPTSVNVVNTPGGMVPNTPTVTVGNAVTVQETAKAPAHLLLFPYMPAGQTLSNTAVWTVPVGTRLVIETA